MNENRADRIYTGWLDFHDWGGTARYATDVRFRRANSWVQLGDGRTAWANYLRFSEMQKIMIDPQTIGPVSPLVYRLFNLKDA